VNSNSSHRAGFTLLELVIVLFVLALASVVVYPDLKPMLEAARLTSTVRETAAFLDGIRTRAVLDGRTLTVSVDEDGTGLVVTSADGEDTTAEDLHVGGGNAPVVERLEMEPETIRYFPGGSSSGGEVSFLKADRTVASVRVGSFTGLADIAGEE
jgi:general secretion pathway protein H